MLHRDALTGFRICDSLFFAMQMFKRSLLSMLFGALALAQAPAASGPGPYAVKDKASDLFKKGDYKGLETVVSLVKGGFDIRESYPALAGFYDAFYIDGKQSEEEWQEQRKKLEEWLSEIPDSLTARIVLSDWYVSYGWKARGSGEADTVTPEGWRLLRERVAEAERVLKGVPPEKIDDPEYYNRWLWVGIGGGLSVDEMNRYFDKGVELAKDYYGLYKTKAYYLLPRWYGREGDWEQFLKESADAFPVEKGDVFYAHLAREQAHFYGETFFDTCDVDYARIKRGYLLEAGHERPGSNNSSDFCYLAAIYGDKETAVKLFLELGDDANIPSFGTRDDFLRLRGQCGAQALLDAAPAAERAGKLDDAEKEFEAFTSDPLTNVRLRFFYERQGMEEKLRGMNITEDGQSIDEILNTGVDASSPPILYDLALIAPSLGEWDKAEAAARKFDQIRPFNLTGKNVLLLCAIHRGDNASAEAMRKEIVDLKTNRGCYEVAQSVLSGGKTWDQARDSMKSDDPYFLHGATAIAFYYLSRGQDDLAKSILQEAVSAHPRENMEKALMESVLYGSLSHALKPQAAAH